MIYDVVVYCEGRRTTDLVTSSEARALARFDELAAEGVRGGPVATILDSTGRVVTVGT